tara:strand:- start:40 stop:594 length:555 start_codon:yes stop_codon:yes gene_type:complete
MTAEGTTSASVPYTITIVGIQDIDLQLPQVVGLLESCFPQEADGEEAPQEHSVDSICGLYDPQCTIWVLARASESPSAPLVGLAFLAPTHNGLFLANLCVLPSLRSSGIGTALLRAAEAEAMNRGHEYIVGTVDLSNVRGMSLYERLGAERVEGMALAGGGARPTAVRLRAKVGVGREGEEKRT